ncbi:MAG: PIG-L family deacetylase [Chromatiaceae bacterium]|nr:PIG-L family deacetylase [Chromatiaceae bacterium]MCP5407975.1 PIG-L family deacetylase [Chromatiaceae bacterium]MCP5442874.1 PIG-L family deacetylase [Chromatiaceae bacterium]
MNSLVDMHRVKRLLCLGAHPDDIELGAGGTVMRLIEQNPGLRIRWVVFCGSDPVRAEEARASAAIFTDGAGQVQVEVHGFRDAFLPWQGEPVKNLFETLKRDFVPDLILTHCDDDRHQDHRLLSQLTWNTWRDQQILEYEILKWDGDLGRPNLYVALDELLCRRKVRQALDAFPSQRSRHWFTEDALLALMRIRGVECSSGFAEAFYARKMIW